MPIQLIAAKLLNRRKNCGRINFTFFSQKVAFSNEFTQHGGCYDDEEGEEEDEEENMKVKLMLFRAHKLIVSYPINTDLFFPTSLETCKIFQYNTSTCIRMASVPIYYSLLNWTFLLLG